jgi:hypothetical protein
MAPTFDIIHSRRKRIYNRTVIRQNNDRRAKHKHAQFHPQQSSGSLFPVFSVTRLVPNADYEICKSSLGKIA